MAVGGVLQNVGQNHWLRDPVHEMGQYRPILKSHNVLQDGQYVEVMNKREMEMIR